MAGKLSNHFFHEDMGGVLIGTPPKKKETSEARGMLHRRCDSFSHLPEHSEFTIRGLEVRVSFWRWAMMAPNAWKHYSPRKLTCLFFQKYLEDYVPFLKWSRLRGQVRFFF